MLNAPGVIPLLAISLISGVLIFVVRYLEKKPAEKSEPSFRPLLEKENENVKVEEKIETNMGETERKVELKRYTNFDDPDLLTYAFGYTRRYDAYFSDAVKAKSITSAKLFFLQNFDLEKHNGSDPNNDYEYWQEEIVAPRGFKYCLKCEKKNLDSAKFCNFCGDLSLRQTENPKVALLKKIDEKNNQTLILDEGRRMAILELMRSDHYVKEDKRSQENPDDPVFEFYVGFHLVYDEYWAGIVQASNLNQAKSIFLTEISKEDPDVSNYYGFDWDDFDIELPQGLICCENCMQLNVVDANFCSSCGKSLPDGNA
jgi:hypothetical protein